MKSNISFEDEGGCEPWLLTYADLFTLLFAFFVLIAASGSVSQGKFDKVRESISKSLDDSQNNELLNKIKEEELNRQKLEDKINEVVKKTNLDELALITKDSTGLNIKFPSKILFTSGTANLDTKFKSVLDEIVNILQMPEFDKFKVIVKGHTDDIPIHTVQYPSNWELSAARAASVVNFMTNHGFKKEGVKVTGYADSMPIVKITKKMNAQEKADARAQNRRIELKIIYYKDQF